MGQLDFEPSLKVLRDIHVDLIRKYQSDIMGTQKGLKEQIEYLADQLTE